MVVVRDGKDLKSRVKDDYSPQDLNVMMQDPDWAVRCVAAERISADLVHEMMGDKHWAVRREVAHRIDPSRLPEMMGDPNWLVNLKVAERIDPKYLSGMLMRETHLDVVRLLRNRLADLHPVSAVAP